MKIILRPALIAGTILLIPFFANWPWTGSDFFGMGSVLFAFGLAYELISRRSEAFIYKAAVALTTVAAFVLVWINLAVGIIGDENPATVLYLGVILILLFGGLLVGFKAEKLPPVLFAAATLQFIVPIIALMFWPGDFAPGVVPVFCINAFFVAVWIAAAMLFRRAQKISGR